VSSRRVKVQNRAELELKRYVGDHAMWHKHVHGVDLDPMQVLKMVEMDRHAYTIDVSCRRTGKSACKEMHALEFLATHAAQELGIVTPRLQQAQTNLNYHLDAIRRSEILRSYVLFKSGREQLTDTRYQFCNGSKAQAYGIMSQIDGDGLALASIDEIDDMPLDRLFSRFLPMLGSSRRLGVSRDVSFKPQIRVTGVYKGADVLTAMLASKQYRLLPTVNVHLAIELGLLNESYMRKMREELPESEYIRQFLCQNISAQNWIWENKIRAALALGTQANLSIAEPIPGGRYKKRGLIGLGYDHTGHGESATASRSCVVITEQMGNFVTFPYVRYWPAGTDERVIAGDLVEVWRYFRPDYAVGDAYGIGLLTNVNDDLFRQGLIEIDRNTIGEGQSTASTWWQWAFAPMRFDGMTKHSMASQLRAVFHHGQAAIAFVDDGLAAISDAASAKWKNPSGKLSAVQEDFISFLRQLGNIKSEPTRASYNSYKMANPALGDDGFDAAMAAVWALCTRGEGHVPTVIESRRQTHQQLLEKTLELEAP
jgi:hypothetical protein